MKLKNLKTTTLLLLALIASSCEKAVFDDNTDTVRV